MENLDLQHKIHIPFAQNGDKDDIPDTSPNGLVNNTDGLGVKYELEIPEGGEYYERQIFNGVLYKVYAAVKELQDLAIAAGFPVDMTKALNVLPIVNGGTGANNAVDARQNLELGALAVLDSISNENIKNQTITGDKIANDAITSAKIAANAVTSSELADNAVDTGSIQNGAVTQAKLASNVVGNLPIGFIYFQLRGQATPDILFGTSGKWQDISSTYAGEFFRAVGGNSGSFGGTQNEGLPNIVGSVSGVKVLSRAAATGAFVPGASLASYDGSAPASIYNISFSASRSNSIYGSSNNVTPYNSAVRIWKKIS